MAVPAELSNTVILKAIDCTNDGIVITAGNHCNRPIVYVNEAFCRLTGFTREDILGQDCRFLQGTHTNQETLQEIRDALTKGSSVRVRLLNYRKDGSTFWNELSISPVIDEQGNITHHIGVQKDITKQVEYEAELATRLERVDQESRTDLLTGLLNRRGLEAVATPVWSNAVRTGSWLSLFFVDIDHFKQVNDRFGHPAGDACLRETARRLDARMNRGSDVLARYGGEEFLILAPGLNPSACRTLGKRLLEDLRFSPPEQPDLKITASIGALSLVPAPQDRLLAAIKKTDMAMYASKQAGRNRVTLHSSDPTEW
jgi:diguanylate cyclase (GGDEF)-like protein/PAS domain S-box-containing protein